MKERLETRPHELKAEFETCQKMLSELEAKQANVRNILVRISGAVQVLQEELAREREPRENDAAQQVKSDEPAAVVL